MEEPSCRPIHAAQSMVGPLYAEIMCVHSARGHISHFVVSTISPAASHAVSLRLPVRSLNEAAMSLLSAQCTMTMSLQHQTGGFFALVLTC